MEGGDFGRFEVHVFSSARAYIIADGGGAPGANGAAHAATDPGADFKTDRETDPGADAAADGVRRRPHVETDAAADDATSAARRTSCPDLPPDVGRDRRADAPHDAARFSTDRRPELRAFHENDLRAVGRPRPAHRRPAREPPGDEQRDAAALEL